MFQRAWKVFQKFCPLCYKQVIARALSLRRIKDKFHLYFQSFHKLPSCENFENTPENLSLNLLGLVRLHMLIRGRKIRGGILLDMRNWFDR